MERQDEELYGGVHAVPGADRSLQKEAKGATLNRPKSELGS